MIRQTLLLFISVVPYLLAQQDMGVITGVVTDASGAAITKAKVEVVNRNTNEHWSVATGPTGAYTAGPFRVGVYSVTVEAPGFRTAVWQGIEVHAQDRVRTDFKLEVGAVLENVSVTASAPLLESETSSLAHVVEQHKVRELPLNGRNFQQLAWLSAGVTQNTLSRDATGGFNAHGQPAVQNNFLIDGIDNNTLVMGLQDLKMQVIVPSLDAVAEFKVETSNYSAEFGRNSGAVMIVNIKSGSNQFHGSAYEYLRNDFFDSRDKFNYNLKADGKAHPALLRQDQFGASLGGPVRHDRTFFFFSWERFLAHRGQTDLATVPTASERSGIFSPGLAIIRDPVTRQPFAGNQIPLARFDATAAKMVSLWPEANLSSSGTRSNYTRNPPWNTSRDEFDMRGDHNFSLRDRMFARFSRTRYHELRDSVFPTPARGDLDGFRNNSDNPATSGAVSYTHIFKPTLLNEFRYGLSRQKALWQELDKQLLSELTAQYGIRGIPGNDRLFGLPQFSLGGPISYTGLGEPGTMPNYKLSQVHQLVDNLSWFRGNHNFKFGADVRFSRSDADIGNVTHGNFTFDGSFTGISFADFLLGDTASASLSTQLAGEMRFRDYMFYAQDDWKLTPRLTINLGLRYELDTPWYDKHNNMSQLEITPGPDFGKILQAGYCGNSYLCRSFSKLNTNDWAPRVGLAYQLNSRTVIRSGFGIFYGGEGALGANGRPIVNFPYSRNVTKVSSATAPALQLSAGFPSDFLGSTTVPPPNLNWQVWEHSFPIPTTYQWNLAVQREIARNLSFTVAYVGSGSAYISSSYNWNGAPPGPPATEPQRRRIQQWNTISLTTPYGHATYHGLDAQLEHRYISGFSLSASYTWSHSIDNIAERFGAGGGGLQDFNNFSQARGNSNFDVRHRFSAGVIYELPFGAGRKYGGWQLSGLLAMQTGHYFSLSVANARPRLGDTAIGTWWPDRIANGRLDHRTADHWFDTSAFVLPRDASGAWHLGNAGRDILNGDGPFNLDLGLMKSFALRESVHLQFRAEAFNLTNTPTLGDPNTNIESPDFGKVRSTISPPRQVQFAVRLSF
jgi:hypothetical protein